MATQATAEAIPAVYRQLVAREPGMLRDVLHIVNTPMPQLQPTEVLVRVTHVGINGGHDTFQCAAQFAFSVFQGQKDFAMGAEGAGIVVAVGSDVTSVAVGDAVASRGVKYREYAVLPAGSLTKVSKACAEAAAVPLSGFIASTVVDHTADVKPGQTVFVTAGAGGAGSFAVQFAVMAGARVLASVGSEAKAAAVRQLGGEPINYRACDIAQVLPATCPEGLDWVIDGVGGDLQDTLIKCMKPGATMILLGYIAEYPHTGASGAQDREGRPSNSEIMWKRATVDLGDGKTLTGSLGCKDPDSRTEITKQCFEKWESGKLKALVDSTQFLGLESVLDAQEYMLSGTNVGKVVVSL